MELVIIGHNEGKHIEQMYGRTFGLKKNWVLDRCTDSSEQKLKDLGETYLKTDNALVGRQTSYARNLGLKQCNKKSDVLFLDGDRYPIMGDLRDLEKSETDITLLRLEEDFRNNIETQKRYGTVESGFFSCGIFFRRDAINKIVDFQGSLFNVDLQTKWGIEDTSLGDVCYHLGLSVSLNEVIRLRGKFEKIYLDDFDTMRERFRFREKLNVKW